MSYFLIHGSEDGTQIIELKDISGLKEYGIQKFRKALHDKGGYFDSNYWAEDEGIVIKGEIVVPKPKKVVEEWEE